MKRLTILSTAIILLASPSFAERGSFRDHSENWLKENPSETTSGGLRSNGDLPTTGSGNEGEKPGTPGAVGEGLLLLTVLAGGYIAGRKTKKESQSINIKKVIS